MAKPAFGARMREARNQMALDDAMAAAKTELKPLGIGCSRETIRKMETGITSEKDADPRWIWALSRVYGTTVAELSPLAEERLERLRDLLSTEIGCLNATAGQPAYAKAS